MPPIPHFGPVEDLLDYQERVFDLCANFRLGAVANPVLLTQRPMAMRVHLDDTLGLGSIVRNHMTVSTVGRVPPLSSPVRVAASAASGHCSGSDRMDQLGTAHVSLVLVNSPKSSKSQTVKVEGVARILL